VILLLSLIDLIALGSSFCLFCALINMIIETWRDDKAAWSELGTAALWLVASGALLIESLRITLLDMW